MSSRLHSAGAALFVVAVVLWTIFILQDAALTGLRAARWVPVENIPFALAKLGLLPVFLVVTARQGLFLAWTIPVVGAVGGVSWYLFRKRIPDHEASSAPSEKLPSLREIISLASAQYATSLISVFTPPIAVLIIIRRLGAIDEAHYYLPALITTSVAFLLWNLVISFLVEGSTNPRESRDHAKTTIRVAIFILLPVILIGVVLAPDILRVFGTGYSNSGTTLLRMLLLSLPGTAVTAFDYSMAWIDKRIWWLSIRELISSAIYFTVLLALIGHLGIEAAGVASLVSTGLQGIFFLPISIRRYRAIPRAEDPEHGTGRGADPGT